MNTSLELMKALGDRNRARVTAALGRYDELCACQITELLSVSGATVSRHMSIFHRAGLVESRKDGRWVYFKLMRPAGTDPLFQWLESSIADSADLKQDFKLLKGIMGVSREDLCRQQRGEECCSE